MGYKLKDWEIIRGEEQMKRALKDGPIACSLNVAQLMDATHFDEPGVDRKKIFSKQVQRVNVDHAINIVGYGHEKGNPHNKYWIIKNSWGLGWNDNGKFKLKMGKDNLGIEGDCAIPIFFD